MLIGVVAVLSASVLLGRLAGGRIAELANCRLRWDTILVILLPLASALQLLAVQSSVWLAALRVSVALAVLLLAVANYRKHPPLLLVAIGVILNLAPVIQAGHMPVVPPSGASITGDYYHGLGSTGSDYLSLLHDRLPLVAGGKPLALVSLGDLLLVTGISTEIAWAMTRGGEVVKREAAKGEE